MWSHEDAAYLERIYDVLYQLGVTANYVGFYYVSYAVLLCVQEPERLQLVTKWLYPVVAEHYNTDWKTVERSIRAMINMVWNENREYLKGLANYPLSERPRTARFLAIVSQNVLAGRAA